MNNSPDTRGVDDLERILGFRGAIDESSAATLTRHDTDLISMPWWTPEFCRTLIRAADAVGSFSPHDDDPVPGEELGLAVISPRLFEAVEADIGQRLWPRLRSIWPLIDYCGLRDAFIIRYEPAAQAALRLHHDVAQISAAVKLNADYEGGLLEFPRQGFDNASLPVGSILVWPSLVTHPHQATPVTAGVKYSLTIWCELPGQYR